MRADSIAAVDRVAAWLSLELADDARIRLSRYAEWLRGEAIAAGGIGPNEANRIWTRHIGDAISFGVDLGPGTTTVDIGSGVGLPGIPLAIVFPATAFELVDRSRRRCDLLERAIAVLGLDNCKVIHRDVVDVDKKFDYVVSRASLPPQQLMIHVKRLLEPAGVAIIGLSRAGQDAPRLDLPPHWTQSTVTVPGEILDTDAHLLRIVAA